MPSTGRNKKMTTNTYTRRPSGIQFQVVEVDEMQNAISDYLTTEADFETAHLDARCLARANRLRNRSYAVVDASGRNWAIVWGVA
jgi:predicted RNA-binding protein associated with RNAse of E/G family